jgi:hypothetical protein
MTVVDLVNVGDKTRGFAEIVALEVLFTQSMPDQSFWILTVDYVDGTKKTEDDLHSQLRLYASVSISLVELVVSCAEYA